MEYKKYDPSYQKFLRKTIISNILIVITGALLICLFLQWPLLADRFRKNWVPMEDNWYCEELQIQFSWEQEECFAIVDGKRIPCSVYYRKGSKKFTIGACPSDFEDIVPCGSEVFKGEYVALNESEFVVMDRDTNKKVVFRKIENGSAS